MSDSPTFRLLPSSGAESGLSCDEPAPVALKGIHHVAIPVTDVARAAQWFAQLFGFRRQVAPSGAEDDDSILLTHACGAAVLLCAAPGRAAAMSGFATLALAVESKSDLVRWADDLSRRGLVSTAVIKTGQGWELRTWGPDMTELRLVAGDDA